ncbi:response regulator transcription factor [Streptomyces sp. NPDC051907]|uniref:response regulator transcription factor n=1 Tax=Streptomyces sp. NPDC051907 TaxID=3155284 RepID=UPI003428BF0E
MTLRVLLADDQKLVRAGFQVLIDSEPGFEVVGAASEGAEAVELTRSLRPDVVLMDIRMPGMDGIAATEEICADADLAAVKVVVLTTFGHDDYVFAALRAGASGFLMKDTAPSELLSAIHTVVAGDSLVLPQRMRHLVHDQTHDHRQRTGESAEELERLSAREREVLELVGRGLTNDEIAAELVLSPLTAKTHVSRIITKLQARDRVQLVILAYETGLVISGPDD